MREGMLPLIKASASVSLDSEYHCQLSWQPCKRTNRVIKLQEDSGLTRHANGRNDVSTQAEAQLPP